MCANFPEKDNKLHFNGCSDRKLVLSDPSAFGVIYLHDYFHYFTYFIEFIMTFFSKTLKLVVATLSRLTLNKPRKMVTRAHSSLISFCSRIFLHLVKSNSSHRSLPIKASMHCNK